jgi:hypothetical protein
MKTEKEVAPCQKLNETADGKLGGYVCRNSNVIYYMGLFLP